MIMRTTLMAFVGLMAFATAGVADEGKGKSGKGKHGRDDRASSSYFHEHGHTRIPSGHMPPPGQCRIWYPDRPPGHQPPPFRCGDSHGRVEPGGMLIRPGARPHEMEVAVYDPRRPGIVIDVGIFDANSGAMIRIIGAR